MTVAHGNYVEAGYSDAGDLLERLMLASGPELCALICDAETFDFNGEQRQFLKPRLWQYILDHRDSNDRNEITAVGAAIRKYVGMMDAAALEEVAVLLESTHGAALSLELELELIKMVYRKFEANPPAEADMSSRLAERLYDIVRAYTHPRVLVHGKHAAVALVAIEALAAMRSWYTQATLLIGLPPHLAWFAEMVTDGLGQLAARWAPLNVDAAHWCEQLIKKSPLAQKNVEDKAPAVGATRRN